MTEAPKIEGPVPATGILGVEGAAGAEQVVLSGYEALLHRPSKQTNPLVQSSFTVQLPLHDA